MKIKDDAIITGLMSSYSGFLLATIYFTAKYEPEKILIETNTGIMVGTFLAVVLFITAAVMQSEINETYKKV